MFIVTRRRVSYLWLLATCLIVAGMAMRPAAGGEENAWLATWATANFDAAAGVYPEGEEDNHPPVADAGADQAVLVGQDIELHGHGSTDPDGDALSFQWTIVSRPEGSTATLSNPNAAGPHILIDQAGTYAIQLIVNDGLANSAPDTVVLSTTNTAPVANAGPDLTAIVGQMIALDGSGSSDPDGDTLSFVWTIVSKPLASTTDLSSRTTVDPSFRVDVAGAYVVQLVVNDGKASSEPDTVIVSTQDTAPVANAGPDQAAAVGQAVLLDGSASFDPDGSNLSFAWSIVSKPESSAAVLTDSTTERPQLSIDVPGTYVLQLLVNDGALSSTPDTVTISTQNTPPIANAGSDQTRLVGQTVQLDGSASIDADGDPLIFAWTITAKPEGSTAALANANTSTPSFVVDRVGVYEIRLVVNDGKADSAPSALHVSTPAGEGEGEGEGAAEGEGEGEGAAEGEGEGASEGEGSVPTETEAASDLLENFDGSDADANGLLSLSEAQLALPALSNGLFNALDANHDGGLSEAELNAVVNPPINPVCGCLGGGCSNGKRLSLEDILGDLVVLAGAVSLLIMRRQWPGV